MTECNAEQLEFHGLGKRAVVAGFDGDMIGSDGGGLLLRETEQRTRILGRLAEQFVDYRDPDAIEHSVLDLVSQRVFALALGYEDHNDRDDGRRWPHASKRVCSVAVGRVCAPVFTRPPLL